MCLLRQLRSKSSPYIFQTSGFVKPRDLSFKWKKFLMLYLKKKKWFMFTLELCIHLCNFRCWEAGLKWVVWSKTTDVQDAFLSTFCSCCMKSYWGAITFAAIEHVLLCDPACMICMLPQTFRLSLCRCVRVREWASMAPGDTVTENGKRRDLRTKCASRSPEADCAADGSFIFEAHEAWKDFHNSLRQFYENGELCDITLKVPPSSHCSVTDYFSITPQNQAVCSLAAS